MQGTQGCKNFSPHVHHVTMKLDFFHINCTVTPLLKKKINLGMGSCRTSISAYISKLWKYSRCYTQSASLHGLPPHWELMLNAMMWLQCILSQWWVHKRLLQGKMYKNNSAIFLEEHLLLHLKSSQLGQVSMIVKVRTLLSLCMKTIQAVDRVSLWWFLSISTITNEGGYHICSIVEMTFSRLHL